MKEKEKDLRYLIQKKEDGGRVLYVSLGKRFYEIL